MKKLVIAKMPIKGNNALVTVLFDEDEAVEIYVDKDEDILSAGDIYVGHVEKVVESVKGAFVLLDKNHKGFLPLSKLKDPVFKTVKKTDELKAGDELIVQVETQAHDNKLAVLNARLKLSDKDRLDEIKAIGVHRTFGTCLYKAPKTYLNLYNKYKDELVRVVSDSEETVSDIGAAASFYQDKLLSLYRLYNLSTVIDRALQRKVWLDSGAFIVIEQTEAFVSIDVNSGKAVRKKDNEESFLLVNKEAAKEIFTQIRKRGLSGMILIDFISMRSEEYKKELLDYCSELAALDHVYTNVVDITKLGIMEITRHKVLRSLKNQIEGLKVEDEEI